MQRGATGRYEVVTTTGDPARAFIPDPLPPTPPLDLSGSLQRTFEAALLALGRMDSLSTLLPEPDLFLYSYVRKEAVLSSQIEGTQSTLSDLLLFELDEAPGVPLDDVVEVSDYVAALDHGIARLRSGFPLSNRLIRELHGKLLASGRGSDKDPGEFRRTQNWIGGTRASNARFVPPPARLVPDCIASLERFLNEEAPALPTLVRAGLVHVQFETIHPFLDGNGRVGRLLISLLLCQEGALRQPLLYLSLYFKEHRDEYYALLEAVRRDGDWEAWLAFFLEGVRRTSESAVNTAQRLTALFAEDRKRVAAQGRRAGSALRVLEFAMKRPLTTLQEVAAHTALSFPTASSAMDLLIELDIARETTGKSRNRVFAYQRYLAILTDEMQ